MPRRLARDLIECSGIFGYFSILPLAEAPFKSMDSIEPASLGRYTFSLFASCFPQVAVAKEHFPELGKGPLTVVKNTIGRSAHA